MFHWFDQTAALADVQRALRPGGALVVYTDFFSGRLREEPRFHRLGHWNHGRTLLPAQLTLVTLAPGEIQVRSPGYS